MTKGSVAQKKFFPTHDAGTHVVDDDQEHHVGEGLSTEFPAVADQSNTVHSWTLVSFLSRCRGDHFQLDLCSSCFLWAPAILFCSKRTMPLLTLLRQAGQL